MPATLNSFFSFLSAIIPTKVQKRARASSNFARNSDKFGRESGGGSERRACRKIAAGQRKRGARGKRGSGGDWHVGRTGKIRRSGRSANEAGKGRTRIADLCVFFGVACACGLPISRGIRSRWRRGENGYRLPTLRFLFNAPKCGGRIACCVCGIFQGTRAAVGFKMRAGKLYDFGAGA